jgi:hypothetical protein
LEAVCAAARAPVEALEQRLLLSASATDQIAALFLTGRDSIKAVAAAPAGSSHLTAKTGHGSKVTSSGKPSAAKPKKAPKAAVPVSSKKAIAPKPVVTSTKPTTSSGSTKKPVAPFAKKPASKPPAAKPAAATPPTTIGPTVAPPFISASKSNPAPITLGQQPGAPDNSQFHGDAARTGFNANETVLTPANVASSFGQLWQSPVLDGAVYATPLYEDSITIAGAGNAANHAGDGVQSSSFQNKSLGVVFAATGGGSVYAIAAQDTNGASGITPGTVLWKTYLGNPYGNVDGNHIGVLATPIIDMASGRLYVAASVNDYLSSTSNPNHGGNNFELFALNIHDGSLVSGFPLIYTQSLLDAVNQNTLVSLANPKVAVVFSPGGADQRGALNMSADGSTVYVDFACYGASNPGWMTTVATGVTNGVSNGQTPAIVSAYSAIDTTSTVANGGMWGAGGPSIDPSGNVFVTTGDNPTGTGNPVGTWGNSVLEFAPGQTLTLIGAYTPWNYTAQDTIDSDLGGGSPIVITLPAGSSTTTDLIASGGKQGNGYLLDGGNNLNNPTPRPGSPANYPASLIQRPPAGQTTSNPNGITPSEDPSLYDTSSAGIRTYWASPSVAQVGPLALFGPYNESSASNNTAKARDTPATFTGPDGSQYVIWAGASKASVGSSTPVAPSLYLTKVVHSAGQPAYLQVVASNTAVMSNPGANLITGNGTANEIDWIVDAGVQRGDALNSLADTFPTGAPVLYAYNALTMQPIWSSSYQQLYQGGKYNSIAVARGNVFVGTNRIQAFGLTADTIVDDAVAGTGQNQFNYVGSGWTHVTGSATMATFDGTVSTDRNTVAGDYATLTFTGSGITLYADETGSSGTATITVDGAAQQTPSLQPSGSSPNGQGNGDVPVYTISGLSSGPHILKILNNAANNTISVDRVEIAPVVTANATLNVSATDGNVIPQAAGVVPYTINFNNQGVVGFTSSNGQNTPTTTPASGTNAAGVTITETVPVNTTADLSNSTSGWTLVSAGTGGAGSAGSVYTYSVGALNAGVTGSVVFSVDLNAAIPPGVTSVSDNVSIADAAGDTATGVRVTPIPPPAETKLIFLQSPPATVSAGIAINPPVTVEAEDQFGNVYTADSSSTVKLTLNDGNGTSFTATMSNGIATFSNIIINDANGTYALTATDGALTSATSNSFTLAASSKLGFIAQPTQTVAGVTMNPAVTVGVENQAGSIIGSDASTVTLSLDHGSFIVNGNSTTTITAVASGGVATFSNIVIDTAGSYTLFANDGNLQQGQSTSFNVVATGTRLVFTQQPENTGANEAVNPSVAVSVEDGFGNVATLDTSTVTLALSTGSFFGGANTATAACVNGVATFNDLVLPAGTYSLAATDPGLSPATSNSFTVSSVPLITIDDNNANNTGSTPKVTYNGSWSQSGTSLANNYGGTITTDSIGGQNASLTFTGNLITLYAVCGSGQGSIGVSIDGGGLSLLNLNGFSNGIQPVYTSGLLGLNGSSTFVHTIEVETTGGTVSIDRFVVGPASPTLAWAAPDNISYGTPLNTTELDAFTSNLPAGNGTFAYSPVAGTILPAGNNVLSVTFTPTDTADYNTITGSVPLTVTVAMPTISWHGPDSDLTYGQSIGAATLDATATINGNNVPGTFVYYGANDLQLAHTLANGTLVIDATVMPSGMDYPLSAVFTPTDTADINVATATNDIDTDAVTPLIVWPHPADITDSTPLSSTPGAQLDAVAEDPTSGAVVQGNYSYTPSADTLLAPGQQQTLGVFFTPTDNIDYLPVTATTTINVNTGPAAKLAFIQQPSSVSINTLMTPVVTVAVEDSAGFAVAGDNSTVTLTLSGGANQPVTFIAQAAGGIATFPNISIAASGSYTLSAADASLIGVTSNPFQIGTAASLDFNTAATDTQFASNFTVTDQGGGNGPTGNDTLMTWGAAAGIDDQDNTTAGGGITFTATGSYDTTGVFNKGLSFNLSDEATHTISQFVTYPSYLGTGDKPLQIGFLAPPVAGATNANLNGGETFVSARIFGDSGGASTPAAEFQSGNGVGTSAASIDTTNFTGAVAAGDWLQLVFTTRETASGSFTGTFAVVDYGSTGVGVGRTVLAPVSYSVTGLTTMGTGSVVYPAFRTQSGSAGTIKFDDFSVDSTSAAIQIAAVQEPSVGTAGVPLAINPILVLQDANGQTVTSDSSLVTITLSQGTFSPSNSNSVSVNAVGGMATFPTLQLNVGGSYILHSIDASPAVDLHFDPVQINGPTQLAFVAPPSNVAVGATMPAVMVAIQDVNGVTIPIDTSTVTLTLSSGTFVSTGSNTISAPASGGVATFSNIAINSAGSYTITASASDSLEQPASPPAPPPVPVVLTPASASFAVFGAATKLAFIQSPTNGTIGTALNPAVTVAVQDANGNTVTSNTATITLTLSGSGKFASTGTGTITANAVNGVATFASLAIGPQAVYTLTASGVSLTAATSGSFIIAQRSGLMLDDTNSNNKGLGANQIAYTGNTTASTLTGAFDNTITTLKAVNGGTPLGTATITFTGTQISFYAVESSSAGKATVTLTGGATTTVDTYSATTKDDVLVYTSAVVPYGTHTLSVQYSGTKNASSSGTNIAVDAFQIADVLPTVTGVTFRSSGWNASFPDASGYAVPGGAGQLLDLPWINLDTISIGFSENVAVTQNSLGVFGVNVLSYVSSGFSYNATTFTATWTFSTAFGADRLRLSLASSGANAVVDASGNKLDGAWVNGATAFPSGDGAAGNDFNFDVNILPGDTDRSGSVNIIDTVSTRNLQFNSVGSSGYSIFNDVDGNASISIIDTIDVRNRQFTSLPAGMP